MKPSQESTADAVSDNDLPSELYEPRWSVVTFENCAASNLTYEEAVAKLIELEAAKIPGLCIVTDEAAKKMRNER